MILSCLLLPFPLVLGDWARDFLVFIFFFLSTGILVFSAFSLLFPIRGNKKFKIPVFAAPIRPKTLKNSIPHFIRENPLNPRHLFYSIINDHE